jgi:Zn-finger nucleic acid-binding protein
VEWRIYSRTGRVYAAELKSPASIQTMHGAVGAEAGDFLVVDLDCERVRYYPARFFHASYRAVERPVPLRALADLSELVVSCVVESDGTGPGETCVRCGKRRTRMEFEGVPTCLDCELVIKAEREETLTCQHDGASMRKEVIQNVIVDRCPQCGGVWFDGGELEILGAGLRRAADFGMPADLASRLLQGLVDRPAE